MPREHFRELEDKIHYCFKDKSLIELAMSHSSYANEKHLGKLGCNERLEFLGGRCSGDRVQRFSFSPIPGYAGGRP